MNKLSEFFTNKLIYIPTILVIASLLGLTIAIFMNRLDYAVRGLTIAVPTFLASLALLKMHENKRLDSNLMQFQFKKILILKIFILIYLMSIVAVLTSSTRPGYYFVLIAILFSIIGIQIFSDSHNPHFILIEIISIAINMAYSVGLKYPYYYGFSDTSYLLSFARLTLISGHIMPPDFFISYANFPLYYIYLAEIAAMIGLDPQTVLFGIMIVPYTIVIFFIFKIFNYVTKNQQISLLACLLYASFSSVIFHSTYIMARVMAYIGFIILLYFLLRESYESTAKFQFSILILIFIPFLILVHQVSIFQFILLLLILMISESLISKKRIIKKKFLMIIIIMTISYWIYVASDFFLILFSRVLIFYEPGEVMRTSATIRAGNEWYYLFTHLDTAILVFFVLCGIGFLLVAYKTKYVSTFALFGLFMLPLFIPNPFQLLWISNILFGGERMILFLAPFYALLMAFGIFFFLNMIAKIGISRRACAIFFIFLIFIFSLLSMILLIDSDSEDLSWQNKRLYFDHEEMRGFGYIMNFIPYGSDLRSDYYANRYFEVYKKFSNSDEFQLPYYTIGNSAAESGYMIFRQKEFQDTGLIFNENSYVRTTYTEENVKIINRMFEPANKIYCNNEIIILYKSYRSFQPIEIPNQT